MRFEDREVNEFKKQIAGLGMYELAPMLAMGYKGQKYVVLLQEYQKAKAENRL